MAAACILIDSTACIDTSSDSNSSTAQGLTSNGSLIEVSLWPAPPSMPSRVSVRLRPNQVQEFLQEPAILCTAGCFFILRVAIGRLNGCPPPRNITQKMIDYFIYRSSTAIDPSSSLKLLPNPHPHYFRDNEVGVLPRGDHFTIAVLAQTTYFKFTLHLFKSEACDWTSKKVLVDPPQIPYPMPLPNDGSRHFQHLTNSVITLGGAIGWVDLWHGVLFYDVLHDDNDKIRLVPLPVRPGSHDGMALECCPKPYRRVAAVGGCLRLVELEPFGDRLPGKDPETKGPRLRIDEWTLITYTSRNVIDDPEDWKIDCTVRASKIGIDRAMRSGLLRCGMLSETRKNGKGAQRNLQNLWTSQPVLSLNDDEGTVVYLIVRVKFRHPKGWLLAVDMANNQVRGMAAIETDRSADLSLRYFPCRISSPVI